MTFFIFQNRLQLNLIVSQRFFVCSFLAENFQECRLTILMAATYMSSLEDHEFCLIQSHKTDIGQSSYNKALGSQSPELTAHGGLSV